jgi:pimeloyl-ACP methyl ester carboxylesterase
MTLADHPIDPAWTSNYAEVNGVKLHYLDTGSGPVLLCLHGTSMTAHCWGHLAASLRDSFRVIALDMRGHGRSDRPATSYTVAEMAGDVAALLRQLGLKDVTIIGSSVGTQVAVSVAASNPDLIAGLILSDPSFFVTDTEIVKYLRSHHTRKRNYPTREEAEAYCRALPQRSGLKPGLHELAMQGDFREEADGSWSWAYDLGAITKVFLNLSTDQSADIAAVKCPVLILNAERSNVLAGEQANTLLGRFRDAKLVPIADSNHTIWGDQPEKLAQLSREFMSSL